MKRIGLAIIHTRGHPRTCEEYPCVHLSTQLREAHPREFGEYLVPKTHKNLPRLIPAHAGNTPASPSTQRRYQTTPAYCRERTLHYTRRTNPAYAGNTPFQYCRRCDCPAHPCVCGEHAQFRQYAPIGSGSSPRMRGARTVFNCLLHCSRVIPAYARNTTPVTLRRVPKKGSTPNMRGTLPPIVAKSGEFSGSPPRMRGSTQDALA